MPRESKVLGRIYAKWKSDGIRGVCRAILSRCRPVARTPAPRSLGCYEQLAADLFRGKVGLEIGGPSDVFRRGGLLPVYGEADRIDNCNFSRRTLWEGEIAEGATFRFDERRPPGRQFICEATHLQPFGSASYDFVLSSHTLEHVANPLLALSEWVRVLKPGGALLLIVPHRDGTFDHHRPVTSLEHLVEDLEHNTPENDLSHLEEILQRHDLALDPPAGTPEQFRLRSLKNLENRCLHHHVFDTQLAVEVVHHAGLQVLAVEPTPPFHIVVMARRPHASMPIDNSRFRGSPATSAWRSPFPSDQTADQRLAAQSADT